MCPFAAVTWRAVMPFSSTASTSEPLASKISRSSTEPIRAARCSGVTVGLGRPENRVRMSERPDKVIPSLRGPYLPRRVRLEHLGAVACSPTASDLASIPRPFGIQGPQNCHFWYASTRNILSKTILLIIIRNRSCPFPGALSSRYLPYTGSTSWHHIP